MPTPMNTFLYHALLPLERAARGQPRAEAAERGRAAIMLSPRRPARLPRPRLCLAPGHIGLGQGGPAKRLRSNANQTTIRSATVPSRNSPTS